MKANGSRVWNPEAASITLRNWAFASSFLPWLFKEKGGRCDPAKDNSSVKSASVQKSVQKIPKSVFLFDDRIEVLSYGSLPFNMSEEDFYAGKSRPINRSLFEIFALSSLAEQSGHGVPLIVERYGKKAFDFSSGTIVVTIPFAFVPEPIKIQHYFSAKGSTGREIENQVLLFFSRAKHRLDAGMRLESRRQRILRQENRRIPSHARETQALWFPQGRVLDRVEEEFFGVSFLPHPLKA